MAVEIPQLNSCCCGCTLKTGTKIIGWLELVGSIFLLVSLWIGLAALATIQDDPSKLPPGQGTDEFIKLIPVMKVLLIVLIVISLISCALAFILLLGVYQNKSNLVMIWIVATLTITIISTCINLAQVIAFQDRNLISHVLSFLLNVYFLLVVHSYYREINNGPNNYA